MKPNQAVLYISDVAAILGKTETAVASAYRRGKIPMAFNCLGKVAWHREQFDTWLAGLSKPEGSNNHNWAKTALDVNVKGILLTLPKQANPVWRLNHLRLNARTDEA